MEFRPVRHANSLTADTVYHEDGSYTDYFGIYWKKSELYFDPFKGPWEGEITEEEVKSYPWPDPHKSDYYQTSGIREECIRLKEAGYIVVADLVSFGTFEQACWMRGFSNLLADFYEDESLIEAIFEKTTQTAMEQFDCQLSIIGDVIDVVCHGDDMGMQDRSFFSPILYKKFIKKHHKHVIDFIKSKTSAKVFLHTCGSVYELIPDLIEVGVDILNPVQPTAWKMQPEKLKQEFGKDLIFWGGVDTQNMLQNGTEEQIREGVKRLIDGVNKDGGYVLAPSHNIQHSVEPAKIEILFDALNEYR
jgi:uroporphyrinogen decarboxylase